MSPLVLPATCLLGVSELTLEATDEGWRETGHHEVIATGHCPHVDIVLPPGSRVEKLRAKVRLADGGRRRIDELRTVVLPPTPREPERLRLLTPDALTGDAVWIDLTRDLPAADYPWTPGAQRGRFASLETDVPFVHDGSTTTEVWFQDAADDARIVVHHPEPQPVADLRPLPQTPSEATFTQTLVIPGDPQRTLYPGGGSTVEERWTLRSVAADPPAALVIPLPSDARDVVVEGPHHRGHGSVTLLIESPVEHVVHWTRDDAPTHGATATLPGAAVVHRVEVPEGRVRWEDDRYWWLAAIGMQRLTPDHRALIRALDQRFRRAALPEPAVPVHLRGMEPTASAVSELRSTLQRRAGVGPLDVDPLFPRRLVKARGTGALTSVEGALIHVLQLGQLGARSTWGLVDPGPAEQASLATPVGYTEGVVVLASREGPVFIDPGCHVCTGFEVRPHLQGTRMLSPVGSEGPPIVEGRATVVDADGVRTVRLDGPPALLVRMAMSDLTPTDRTPWLERTFGGEGATFGSVTGLGVAGAPIVLTLTLGAAPVDGRFVAGPGWVGERRWEHAAADAPAAHVHTDDLCALTRREDDRRIDVLTVNDHRVPNATWTTFRAEVTAPSDDPVPRDEP